MTQQPKFGFVDIFLASDLPSLQSLRDYIEWLISQVPEEYRETAVVRAGELDGWPYIEWEIRDAPQIAQTMLVTSTT